MNTKRRARDRMKARDGRLSKGRSDDIVWSAQAGPSDSKAAIYIHNYIPMGILLEPLLSRSLLIAALQTLLLVLFLYPHWHCPLLVGTWLYTHGHTHMAVHTWLYTHSGTHMVVHTWRYTHGCTHIAVHTVIHADFIHTLCVYIRTLFSTVMIIVAQLITILFMNLSGCLMS